MHLSPRRTGSAARRRPRGSDGRDHRIVGVLLATTAVRSLGRGTFITVMTLYLTRFLGASPSEAGMVITTGSLAGIAGSYAFGRLSDRVAARRILVALMLGESLAFAGFAWAPSYAAVFPFAMLLGSANLGGSAVRSVVVAREFQGADRVSVRAKMYMANNVGIGLGASLGAVALVSDGHTMSKLVMGSAAVLYLIAALVGLLLPRTAGVAVPVHGAEDPAVPTSRLVEDRRFLVLTGLSAVLGIHLAFIEVAMPLWVTLQTDAPRYMVTVLLVLNTVLVIVLQMPAARRSVDPRSAGHLILWSALALAVGNALMWAAHAGGVAVSIVLLVVAVVAWTIGEVSSQAGTWTLSFELSPPAVAGAYQGFFTMGWHTGVMLGPVVVTSLAVAHGLLGWLALSVLILVAGGLLCLLGRRVPTPAELHPAARA
jgi:MFS family permease